MPQPAPAALGRSDPSPTDAALDEAIGAAVDALLRSGVLGEASAGLRVRHPAQSMEASVPST